MEKGTKAKQIVVRFDIPSYDKIHDWAAIEHRGLGEFVRHAVLVYIEQCNMNKGKFKKGSVNQMCTKAYMTGYPENVYCVIFGETEYPNMPPDAEETLEYLMGTLTQREAEMLMFNYKDEMTYVEIGEKYGFSKERVRQIISKAIRKLRHHSRSKILSMGREAYLKLVVTASEEEKGRYYERISELEALIRKQIEATTAFPAR